MRVLVVLVVVLGCDAGAKPDDPPRSAPAPLRPVVGLETRMEDHVRAGVLDISVVTKSPPSPRIARDLEQKKIADQLQVCARKWLKPPQGAIYAHFMVDGEGHIHSLETGNAFSGHCFRPILEHMQFSRGEHTNVELTAMYQPVRQDDYLANRQLGRMDLNVYAQGLTTEEVVRRLAPARAALEQCVAAKAGAPILNIGFVIGEKSDELEFYQWHHETKEPCAEAAIRKLDLTVPGGAEVELSMVFGPR